MGIEIQWPLVLFSLLAGSGGTLLAFVGLSQFTDTSASSVKVRSVSSIVSMVMLAVGGIVSVLHLASPQNVMAAATNIFSFSGISIELILLGITLIVAFLYLVFLKRGASKTILNVLAILGIVFGLLLAFFCGHGYVMQSRPMWDTELLPIAYLGTAFAVGGFLLMFINNSFAEEEKKEDEGEEELKGGNTSLEVSVLAAAAVCALSCFGYAFFLVINGNFGSGIFFWFGLVVCGIAGVLICGIALILKRFASARKAIVLVGLIVAVIAALSVRVLMWEVGDGYLELFEAAKAMSFIM